MNKQIRVQFFAICLTLFVAACAQTPRETPMAAAPVIDDDAYCSANAGTPGSPAYVACRKDRDVGANRAAVGPGARLDRAHKNLAEDMLNGKR